MPNEIIRTEFFNKVRSALNSARNVSQIDHPGVRGRAREIFVQDMLRPILPPYVEFGSGKIADSKGNMSAETDVVIYSRQTLPPLLFESDFGIYPAEAVIYAIEVKSKLTVAEIQTTIKKFARLRDLQYLPSALNERYQQIAPNSVPAIPWLFAFETDLAYGGKDELERYREYDANADSNPIVPVFCVAGRGYWWFKPNEPKEKWIKHLPTDDHEEAVEFIGGIANTIPDQVMREGRPRFGEYIIRPRQFEKH
jgi:hypothetical protein